MQSPNEKTIEKQILQYLTYLKDGYFWKNNSTGVYDPVKNTFRKAKSPFLINGVSDIIGIYQGKVFFIEVKTKTGRQSVSQKLFQANIERCGGTYLLVRSLSDIEKHFPLKKLTHNE